MSHAALTRSLERLKSYGPADLDRDIRAFAQNEVEVEDPLQARRLGYGATVFVTTK